VEVESRIAPKGEWKTDLKELTARLMEFNSEIWDTKKKQGLSLKESIKMEIPKELEMFKKDLIAMHNIKS